MIKLCRFHKWESRVDLPVYIVFLYVRKHFSTNAKSVFTDRLIVKIEYTSVSVKSKLDTKLKKITPRSPLLHRHHSIFTNFLHVNIHVSLPCHEGVMWSSTRSLYCLWSVLFIFSVFTLLLNLNLGPISILRAYNIHDCNRSKVCTKAHFPWFSPE